MPHLITTEMETQLGKITCLRLHDWEKDHMIFSTRQVKNPGCLTFNPLEYLPHPCPHQLYKVVFIIKFYEKT